MTSPGLGAARGKLLIVALLLFAGVTTEMLPVGLLPSISRTFDEPESATGLIVTLYASLVAVLALPLTLATRRVPRKGLLLTATGCFAVGNLLSAVAPTFAVFAVARALGGATHAVFFSLCIGYAARLVPAAKTGAALALASVGISAGFVLGVPLATALGNAVGWRGSFVALAALMALALVLVAVKLPAVQASAGQGKGLPGRRPRLLAVVSSNALLYAGHYTLYTYVTVLLLRAGAAPGAIGPVLLLFGGIGLVGVWIAGRQLDRRFRQTAFAAFVILCAGILGAGISFPVLGLVIIAGAVWNGAFGPAASIYQTAAVRVQATMEDLAGAWIVATSNIGIAVGAASGGIVLHDGVRAIAWTAAVPVALAAVIVLAARRAFPATTAEDTAGLASGARTSRGRS